VDQRLCVFFEIPLGVADQPGAVIEDCQHLGPDPLAAAIEDPQRAVVEIEVPQAADRRSLVAAHLAYDLAVFLALGSVCEARWPRRTRLGLCVALALCSAAVLLGAPELATYRGLSGLDSALLALLAARLQIERAFRSAWMRLAPALAGLGLLGKIAYELSTDAALFAGGADLFVPVPLAHLAGGAVGLAAALWPALPVRDAGAAGEPATTGAR
jgi:hypothetical protein